MTAAAADRRRRTEHWKLTELPFAVGDIGYKGTACFLNTLTAKVGVVPAVGLVRIGILAETVDASTVEKAAQIDLEEGIWIEWFANSSAADAVLATDIGKIAYMADDSTVSILPIGKVPGGRVWKVDSIKGVAIQKLHLQSDVAAGTPAVAAYVANDYILATVIHGAIYDVPTTAAASTVTLPVGAPDGTVAQFFADGTKNGHTVQYRDVTGPVNLTTALLASKRHLVTVAKRDGKWAANAYVAP